MNFSLANFAPKIFKPTQKNILQLDPSQAFSFFMQHDSYSSINLPPYFRFTPMLHEVRNSITGIDLSKLDIKRFKDSSEVNYAIYSPKGDKYSWRKLKLINPILYIKIVELITEPNNWNSIQKRFLEFGSNPSHPLHEPSRGQRTAVKQVSEPGHLLTGECGKRVDPCFPKIRNHV